MSSRSLKPGKKSKSSDATDKKHVEPIMDLGQGQGSPIMDLGQGQGSSSSYECHMCLPDDCMDLPIDKAESNVGLLDSDSMDLGTPGDSASHQSSLPCILGAQLRGVVSRGRVLESQTRLVIGNCVARSMALGQVGPTSMSNDDKQMQLRNVPTKVLMKELLNRISDLQDDAKSREKLSLSTKFAAAMMGLRANTCHDNFKWASMDCLQSCVDAAESAKLDVATDRDAVQRRAMRVVVRKILANGVRNQPYNHYPPDMMELLISLQDILGETAMNEDSTVRALPMKFLAPWAVPVIEFLGAHNATALLGQYMRRPLDGLEIPSDLSLHGDPYTIGEIFHSCRGTVFLTSVTFSTPGFSGGSTSIFACSPGCGTDYSAVPKAESLIDGLRSGPLAVSVRYMKKVCAEVALDGAYTKGAVAVKHHNPIELPKELSRLVGRPLRSTWDLFHRINKGGKKVFTHSALMQRFLRLLHDLESCFGGGQGRSLDMALSEYLQQKHAVHLVQAGTREFGFLIRCPVRFLQKLKDWHCLIQVRLAHSQAGRSTHGPVYWTALGNTLSDSVMTTFILCLCDTLAAMQGFVLIGQDIAALSSEKQAQFRVACKKLEAIVNEVKLLMDQIRMMQAVEGYLRPKEKLKFWRIWCTHKLRHLPMIVAKLPHILVNHTFDGCSQNLDFEEAEPMQTKLHPACQCAFRKPRFESATVPVLWKGFSKIMKSRKKKGRKVGVPRWTIPGQSPLLGQDAVKKDLPDDWNIVFGRLVHADKMAQPPRHTCRVPRRQDNINQKVLEGLVAAREFALDLVAHMQDYSEGDLGLTKELQNLSEDFQCWEARVLTSHPEMDNDRAGAVDASFSRLWRAFASELQYTFWPQRFSATERKWPQNPPLEDYHKFAQLISKRYTEAIDAYARRSQCDHSNWVKTVGYEVVALHMLPPVSQAFRRALPLKVMVAITLFGDAAPFVTADVAAPKAIEADVLVVSADCKANGALGSIVMLNAARLRARFALPISTPRLVVIRRVLFEPDGRAIFQSIESEKEFSEGKMWYVARAAHRHRRISCQTNFDETMGSILNHFWNPTGGHATASIVARLMLRTSGFCGDGSDDIVVDMTCDNLLANCRMQGRAKRSAAYAGLSEIDVIKRKLLPSLSMMKATNSELLTSSHVGCLRSQVSCTQARMSTWRLSMNQWKRKFDSHKVSPQDLAIFQKFATTSKKPEFSLMPMTSKQQFRYSKLALSEKRRIHQAFVNKQKKHTVVSNDGKSRRSKLPRSCLSDLRSVKKISRRFPGCVSEASVFASVGLVLV